MTIPREPVAARAVLTAFLVLAGGVLVASVITRLCAPVTWRDPPARALPDEPGVLLGILLNNLVIGATPALAGWQAAHQRERGRGPLAVAFVALAAVVVLRAVMVIGFVGGLDPAWLLSAARWWTLELLALAISVAAGWAAWREVSGDPDVGRAAMRRALVRILVCLTVAALIEVALA